MSWLVTGGAGYVGAHVVHALVEAGHEVAILDDLSTGSRRRVHPAARFVEGSVLDPGAVAEALRGVRGVVHVAAKKQVGESVAQPLLYYRENVHGLTTLLDGCHAAGVDRFLFSSSAATYGVPDAVPVTEDAPTAPINPYGRSKLVGEWALRDCATAFGLRATILRYFNVAGTATPELGDPGTFNLVPLALQAIVARRRPQVYGDDYPTPDGTCVRDYVHVADVAAAHVAAVAALDAGEQGGTYNVGRGVGSSVLEVLRVIGEVTGLDASYDVVGRRPGDPAVLVASADQIRAELGVTCTRSLREMVQSAWEAWPLTHPS